MFFNGKSKKVNYEAYLASGVNIEADYGDSCTNNLPNHTVIDENTWEYEKMEDVPFPIGEDWEWVECYKALYKTYSPSKDKVEYLGPSQNLHYELNKIYALPEEGKFSKIDYCGNGFHACLTIKDALTWYNYISYFGSAAYGLSPILKIGVVAKARLLVNKKDLKNCYGKSKLDTGKIVGKAIILIDFVSPEEVYDNRKENVCWNTSALNSNARNYLKTLCEKEGINIKVLEKLTEKLDITLFTYKQMLGFLDDGKTSPIAYIQALLYVYRENTKEIYQVLERSYGRVLTEEILGNLDYQFAMRLADNNDAYNRDLSTAEKMQILYSHQMLLK